MTVLPEASCLSKEKLVCYIVPVDRALCAASDPHGYDCTAQL